MINKKKSEMSFPIVIGSIIGLIILVVIVSGLIKGIFVDKQLAFAGQTTEQVTQDCDEDNFVGITDNCPCDSDINKLEKGQKCGGHSPEAGKNCPALCSDNTKEVPTLS
ncbi:hypothetical protein ISS07_01420 [Candidatus Woesearchaeota archaeon]|nr:hypothetical protein [Candidatus Woesearchaeota archaeon]